MEYRSQGYPLYLLRIKQTGADWSQRYEIPAGVIPGM
jgi:hypothetical protein